MNEKELSEKIYEKLLEIREMYLKEYPSCNGFNFFVKDDFIFIYNGSDCIGRDGEYHPINIGRKLMEVDDGK